MIIAESLGELLNVQTWKSGIVKNACMLTWERLLKDSDVLHESKACWRSLPPDAWSLQGKLLEYRSGSCSLVMTSLKSYPSTATLVTYSLLVAVDMSTLQVSLRQVIPTSPPSHQLLLLTRGQNLAYSKCERSWCCTHQRHEPWQQTPELMEWQTV